MNSKILTVTVPCYNSASFMSDCVESLLPGGDDLEIILIDDGSPNDNTWEIARQYQERYPNIVRAIHQENGGYGEAVNTGMREATGTYFGIMDADDTANVEHLKSIIKRMKEIEAAGTLVDLVLCNYVYCKEGEEDVSMDLKGPFETDKILHWNDMKRFGNTQYIMIHNVFYRMNVLEECDVHLPSHVCYSDNILVLYPLAYCDTIYYMDVDYYRYTIGRPDQSVNEAVQIRQLDQQLFITRKLIDHFAKIDTKKLPRKLYKYMARDLSLILATTSIFLYIRNQEGDIETKKKIWRYVKKTCRGSYFLIFRQLLSLWVHLPGKRGRRITVRGYNWANKKLNFR